MPRMSNHLFVSEEDQARLNSMLLHSDHRMQERIRIVLACAVEPSNKKVAESLGVDEHKVARWKESFRKNGMEGLQQAHGGGRKARVEMTNLEELVLSKIAESDREWTVHALAENIGCSDYQVSAVLAQKGISLARRHSWTYRTADTVQSSDVDITGIYLSGETCVVILCHARYGFRSEQGVLETWDRDVWERLNRSPVQVSLPNVIFEMEQMAGSGGNASTAGDYVRDFAARVNTTPGLTYRGFVLSVTFCYSRVLPENMNLECFSDVDEWEYAIHSWIGARTAGIRLCEFEMLQKVIRSFAGNSSNGSRTIWWTKAVTQIGTEEEQIPYVPCEEVKGWDAADEGNHPCGNLLSSPGKLRCGLIAFVSDDRQVLYKTIESGELPQPDQFDYSSKKGLVKGISQIENPMILLRNQAGLAVTDMYLDSVKKN